MNRWREDKPKVSLGEWIVVGVFLAFVIACAIRMIQAK